LADVEELAEKTGYVLAKIGATISPTPTTEIVAKCKNILLYLPLLIIKSLTQAFLFFSKATENPKSFLWIYWAKNLEKPEISARKFFMGTLIGNLRLNSMGSRNTLTNELNQVKFRSQILRIMNKFLILNLKFLINF